MHLPEQAFASGKEGLWEMHRKNWYKQSEPDAQTKLPQNRVAWDATGVGSYFFLKVI